MEDFFSKERERKSTEEREKKLFRDTTTRIYTTHSIEGKSYT